MLHFLSSLFKPFAGEAGVPDKALIEAVAKRAIDATDPRLRASFVSAEHLQEVLGGIKTVKDYLQGVSGPLPDAIFGLLSMAWKERTVLGTEHRQGSPLPLPDGAPADWQTRRTAAPPGVKRAGPTTRRPSRPRWNSDPAHRIDQWRAQPGMGGLVPAARSALDLVTRRRTPPYRRIPACPVGWYPANRFKLHQAAVDAPFTSAYS